MTPAQFWARVFQAVKPSWWAAADKIIADAEPRRRRAKFNTGSISQTAAVALRAIVTWASPGTIAEVGTFIGISTHSMALHDDAIWTCDVSNDCVDSHDRIVCHPYQTSTQMLTKLKRKNIKIGMFFFDGLLSDEDVSLIQAIAQPHTVFVFDDYNGEYKGVKNVEKLAPVLSNHVLMPGDGWVKDDTTLAVLAPTLRL